MFPSENDVEVPMKNIPMTWGCNDINISQHVSSLHATSLHKPHAIQEATEDILEEKKHGVSRQIGLLLLLLPGFFFCTLG